MNGINGKVPSYVWKTAGWCVAAASMLFIGYKLTGNPAGDLLPALNAASIGMVAFTVLLYSLLNFLLAFIWARFVIAASGGSVPVRFLIGIYLRSGIVKYLPGNIFHLAGRHILAGRAGVGQGSVLVSNIFEMAVISVTALIAIFTVIFRGELNGIDVFIGRFRYGTSTMVIAVGIFISLSAGIVLYCRKKYPIFISASMFRTSLTAIPLYIVFFTASSLILSGLLSLYGNDVPSFSFFTFFGVFCLSWIAGFLAPGAPGGLGVRESVIVLMLGSTAGEGPALGAALLLRMVTAAGDVLSFLYSFFLKRKGGR